MQTYYLDPFGARRHPGHPLAELLPYLISDMNGCVELELQELARLIELVCARRRCDQPVESGDHRGQERFVTVAGHRWMVSALRVRVRLRT